jgi:hypothetical protein
VVHNTCWGCLQQQQKPLPAISASHALIAYSNGHLLDASMSQTATHLQPTGSSTGTGKREYKPHHSSHSIVEHPFTGRSNEVDDSTLDAFPPSPSPHPDPPHFKEKTIHHMRTHPTDISLLHGTAAQLPPSTPTPSNQSSAPTATLAPPSYPPSNPSKSLESVQSWLAETTLPSTFAVASTRTLQELDVHVNGRKRKRGASIELDEAGLAVPLTREALKKYLKATMSSTQSKSSVGNVCSSYIPPDRN